MISKLILFFYTFPAVVLLLSDDDPMPCGDTCWADLQLEANRLAIIHDLPLGLLQGMMWVECWGDPWALGSSDDFGPMQIIPSTASGIAKYTDFTVEAILSDPMINLQAGAWHLASLVRMFRGDVDLALAAYNAGLAAVLECDCVPTNAISYVDGVRWFWNQSWLPVLTALPTPPTVWETPNQWFADNIDLPPLPQCLAKWTIRQPQYRRTSWRIK